MVNPKSHSWPEQGWSKSLTIFLLVLGIYYQISQKITNFSSLFIFVDSFTRFRWPVPYMLTFKFGEWNMSISTNSLVMSFTCRIVDEDAHFDDRWCHHFHWNIRRIIWWRNTLLYAEQISKPMSRWNTLRYAEQISWIDGNWERGERRKSRMRRKNAGWWVRGGGEKICNVNWHLLAQS